MKMKDGNIDILTKKCRFIQKLSFKIFGETKNLCVNYSQQRRIITYMIREPIR